MSWEADIINAIGNKAGRQVPTLSPPIELATVITPPPDLSISLRGQTITKESLYVNAEILKDYRRTVDLKWSDPHFHRGDYTGAQEAHMDAIDAEATTKDELKAGDQVAVLPFSQKQSFLIICKVVRL